MRELKGLTLEGISKIDGGRFAEAFQRHLLRVGQDCYDRPGDSKERKVSLSVSVKPKLDQDGMCESVDLQLETTSTVPKHRSKKFDMGLKPNGNVLYQEDNLENHGQEMIDFEKGEQ